MRVFIAILLDQRTKESLFDLQNNISDLLPVEGIRPEKKINFHITLNFLGEIPPAEIETLSSIVSDIAGLVSPQNGFVDKIGVFPGNGSPRVVWAGISSEAARITRKLNMLVARNLAEVGGYEIDGKRFHPHITLFRVKRRLSGRVKEKILKTEMSPGIPLKIHNIALMNSLLTQEGAIHEVLVVRELGGG